MYQQQKSALKVFNQLNMRYSTYEMLSYLDQETLENLLASLKCAGNQSYFTKLVQGVLLIKKYINKADRSIYYYFYQQNFIAETDYINTISLVQKNSIKCSTMLKQYNKLFSMLKGKCMMEDQQIAQTYRIVCEPDLSLPNNLRQNVGKYCNSPYQFYLCSLENEKSYEHLDLQTSFESFKLKASQKEEQYLIKILKCRSSQIEEQYRYIQKIMKIRLYPNQKIENANELVIQGFQLHNLIVVLLSLADQTIKSSKIYLNSIQNPFNQFIEFNLRYSIFRNFMLQIEQNLGFVFKLYNGLFEDAFNCSMQQNTFSFTKICLDKFKAQMVEEMKTMLPVYTYFMKHISSQNFKAPSMNVQPNQQSSSIFQPFIGSVTEDYLIKNKDSLQMCMVEFVQVFIDLSVDRQTINWCGHSCQQLKPIYQLLQTAIINECLSFAHKKLAQQQENQISEQQQLIVMLTQELILLQKINVKPVTLRHLCEKFNQMIGQAHIIAYDFTEKDNLLNHMNRNSFSLSNFDQKKQLGKITTSEITDDSSNTNSDSEEWQYNSQGSMIDIEEMQHLAMEAQ